MTEVPFSRVAVLGVGLLGGSVGMALKRADRARSIIGVGRGHENLETARKRGIVDEWTTDPAGGVRGADLVVLASPVGTLEKLAETIGPHLQSGCRVTDVGSVKGGLVSRIETCMPKDVRYLGSHPIAGGSDSGATAARADLFDGAPVVLTPTAKTGEADLQFMETFWRDLGARPVIMDPEEHDRVLSAVSHLPHMVAYALAASVSDRPDWAGFIGRGFLDTTRIASSPPEVWTDIFRLNRSNLLDSLKRFEMEIGRIRERLAVDDEVALRHLLSEAKETRDRFGAG